jgi:hypothetical protein
MTATAHHNGRSVPIGANDLRVTVTLRVAYDDAADERPDRCRDHRAGDDGRCYE